MQMSSRIQRYIVRSTYCLVATVVIGRVEWLCLNETRMSIRCVASDITRTTTTSVQGVRVTRTKRVVRWAQTRGSRVIAFPGTPGIRATFWVSFRARTSENAENGRVVFVTCARAETKYFLSASNLTAPNSSNVVLSGTILKLTPTNSVVEPVGTVVNFTCSYVSAVPMEIDMHTRHTDDAPTADDYYSVSDSQYGPYVNFTGGAERVLMVRIKRRLTMVVCSLYNKHRYQLGQISTLIYPGASITRKKKQTTIN